MSHAFEAFGSAAADAAASPEDEGTWALEENPGQRIEGAGGTKVRLQKRLPLGVVGVAALSQSPVAGNGRGFGVLRMLFCPPLCGSAVSRNLNPALFTAFRYERP